MLLRQRSQTLLCSSLILHGPFWTIFSPSRLRPPRQKCLLLMLVFFPPSNGRYFHRCLEDRPCSSCTARVFVTCVDRGYTLFSLLHLYWRLVSALVATPVSLATSPFQFCPAWLLLPIPSQLRASFSWPSKFFVLVRQGRTTTFLQRKQS